MTTEPSGKQPERRYVIELKAGADSLKDLASILGEFADAVSSGGTNLVTGGLSAGGHFVVRENPDMTHDRYIEAVEVWRSRWRERNENV